LAAHRHRGIPDRVSRVPVSALGRGRGVCLQQAPYPHLWRGFTLDWFLGNAALGRTGLFADGDLLGSIWTSCIVAVCVTILSALVGTTNAFLIERGRFWGKQVLSVMMLAPLVIPGVILGISILAFASRIAEFADDTFGLELDFLRPGLPLVVLGQFSYIATIATLTISARLRRFDSTLEEAALNLGASKIAVFHHSVAVFATGTGSHHLLPDVIRGLQHHPDAGRRTRR
jgi:spermidine/putrescine transport system permease protein